MGALVGTPQIDNAGATTTTLNFTPTAGNLLVVGQAFNGVTQPASMSDNKGNPYTRRGFVHETTSGNWIQIWTAPMNSVAASMVITHGGSDTLIISQWSGIDLVTANPVAATGASQSGTGTPNTSITTTLANQVVVAMVYDEGTVAQTAGTGWTLLAQGTDNVSHERGASEYQIPSTASTVTVTMNNMVAPWGAVAVALYNTGTGPANTTPTNLFFF